MSPRLEAMCRAYGRLYDYDPEIWAEHEDACQRAVRLVEAAGYAIVPRAPTLRQTEAGVAVKKRRYGNLHEIYCAMVAAAEGDEP